MNGVCGSFSIFSSARYLITNDPDYLWSALALPLAGMLFDFFDGKVARWRKSSSLIGQELDSLADLVRAQFECYQLASQLVLDFVRSSSGFAGLYRRPSNLSGYSSTYWIHMLRTGPSGTVQCDCRSSSERRSRQSQIFRRIAYSFFVGPCRCSFLLGQNGLDRRARRDTFGYCDFMGF